MDAIAQALKAAQDKAAALFDEVVARGLICAGKLESELSQEVHELARDRYGLRRHWHKRVVRAGPNALLGYYDESVDRRIVEDDLVFLDLGPVFEEWEADFGRSYALGPDPEKHRLVADLAVAFAQGKEHFRRTSDLTAGQLYDFVQGLAAPRGWEFGAVTAGHLVGHFPHERTPAEPTRFSIRHGNNTPLREKDDKGAIRHWILEIHLVDRARGFGGFLEELLTI